MLFHHYNGLKGIQRTSTKRGRKEKLGDNGDSEEVIVDVSRPSPPRVRR